ncbi:PCC domain-containing protein [Paracoccus pacificus]|uniref:PCC domain-containing protein n=1 Tax=Paracoccus pacificus TaxID=1463598 RepID=A0ABW4RB85_9RHOB
MVHPGPRAAVRVQALRTALVPLSGVLRAGESVMQGVARIFADAGCPGGIVWLDGVTCDPMRYVLPAYATDDRHAAWYSETHAPDGPARILRATASVGQRDGDGFLHCHGTWRLADGLVAMGHLLPFDSIVARDSPVRGLGTRDAWFEGLPDAETNFTLFQPRGGDPAGAGLVVRLLPGEDVVTAIQRLCAAHDIADARVHGLGSIDHIGFAEGHSMDCLATELRLDDARIKAGRAILPIEVVDVDGNIARGTLTAGDNPVGVTMEIVIEPLNEEPKETS